MIEFGPDGYLYVGMGDGGSANDPQNRAQNLGQLLGKILRLDVDAPDAKPEIFASGFRNPWRFSFDRATGLLYAGDVGQNAREEIDIVTQGGNYGWRVWEGTLCTGLGPAPCSAPGFIPPIVDYVNTGENGRCAIIGGYVYRGTQASLPDGAYLYGDLCSGEIFMLKDGTQTTLLDTTFQLSSFGEDEAGEIYVVALNGSIFRISNPDVTRVSQRSFTTTDTQSFVTSTAGASSAPTVGYARIQADSGAALPSSGLAIFGFRQNGVLVSEASVPASPPILSGRTFAEVDAHINTGIALANPNANPITVSFYFSDVNGANSGEGTTAIPANGQIAAFVNQAPFNGSNNFVGTFSFTASAPIAAAAVRGFTNERGEFLLTGLPVLDLNATPTGNIIIPHFASGGDWATDVVLLNPSNTGLSGAMEFLDTGGHLIRNLPYLLAPRSLVRFAAPVAGAGTQTGSIRFPAGPAGLAIFSYRVNGTTVDHTSVPAVVAGTAFRVVVGGSETQTSIAIANPSSAAAAELTLEQGVATDRLSVPKSGQTALFLSEIPGFGSQGVLRITSSIPVGVIALRSRTNERGEYLITTTPPFYEAPDGARELFFPHFAEGAGYTMQFILVGGPSSGTINFVGQTGAPAALLLK
jgi:hypothetical protein